MAKKGGLGKGLDAIFMENESENKNSTITLPISEIEPNKDQPRQEFDETALAQLAESISAHGLLQPLLVRPLLSGGYQIVAGERRYRACRMAGITEVPVLIRELSDVETLEIALIENLQRENLNPIEEAYGYKTLIDEYDFSQEEVSRSVGKSRPAIANALRLLNLPEYIRQKVEQGAITSGHARALLPLEDDEQKQELCDIIILNDLSVRQVEKIVKAKLSKTEEKPDKQDKITVKPKYFSEVELALTEHLGKKVVVTPLKNKKGGILQIEFYSDDDLKDIAKYFE